MDSKSTTVLTNLQRGNIEAKISTTISLNFFEKCAQGEVLDEEIRCNSKIDHPDAFGFTAIHYSSFYGQLKTTEKLLDFGADPNTLAANFISPLHLASSNGHQEIVRLLISKGANINQMDINGNTPLHYSAANNFPHSTNEILSSPAADVMIENEDGKTAYHLSIENKSYLAQAVIETFIMNTIN